MSDLALSPATAPAPVADAQRIVALDVVRGLAVLGILAMNVVEFAHPLAVYGDPTAGGGASGSDLVTWYVQQALFDGRMRALFSMLFGAGIVLLGDRLRQSGRGDTAADILLRRCLWLVPFGLLHRFLLQWTGDILYQYGLLGALAIAFRNLRARTLVIAGLAVLAMALPIEAWRHHQTATVRDQAAAAQKLQADGKEVPKDLEQARQRWERRIQKSKPEDTDAEKKAMRGGYTSVFAHRWDYHHTFQSAYLYYIFVWDVFGMLLVGMGLCRCGFFAGTMRTRAYGLAIAGGALAAAASLWTAVAQAAGGFDKADLGLHFAHEVGYPFLRLLGGLGWAAALILCVRAARARWLTAPLEKVGRMAFSNYVLQTVLCTLFFFGYGLGFYGELPRHQLAYVWLAASAVQVVFSLLWLRAFSFGPLEWVWRSLTYWHRPPMRRAIRSGTATTPP